MMLFALNKKTVRSDILKTAMSTLDLPFHAKYFGFFHSVWARQYSTMGLLPDTQKCGLRMRSESQERFPATEG